MGWYVIFRPSTSLIAPAYGRTVATCAAGDADLGEWLVRKGLALDWPQYSKGRCAAAQRDAERTGRGLWTGSYVAPWHPQHLVAALARGRTGNVSCDD